MKHRIAAVAALLVLPAMLGACVRRETDERQYTASFLGLFDTVTYVVGHARSEEAFAQQAEVARQKLEQYHRLLDVYNAYDNLNNLKTINDLAGRAPVQVDGRIIDFLKDCKRYYALSGGRVNIALGGVFSLWREARERGLADPARAALPDEAALWRAAEHGDIDDIVIDESASMAYLADPLMQLDVGAVAKGWATERVARELPEGYLLSVGGNVCAAGPKQGGAPWSVGVRVPDGGSEDFLHTLSISSGSVVTSGDYQRAYWVDGKRYHHIIDPDTLYPAVYWRAVTVVCDDSGMGDMLSTALFLMPLEQGLALAEKCGAQAMWVDENGGLYYSEGYRSLIRSDASGG